jgi:carbon monoxide dehydrogenase subunit G
LELRQQVSIPVEPEVVWHALNDPEVLRQCLPGCDVFERTGEDTFEIALTAKVGPVKARFKGDVSLSNVLAPVSYTISGSGKGGVAGFAKGSADVSIESEGHQATRMTYLVKASVGGKLAQIGSRLVTGAARKMADDFFAAFVRTLCNDNAMEVQVVTLET